MSSSPTNNRLSSAWPRTPSAASTASARRAQRTVSTGTATCSSATNTSGSPSPPSRFGPGTLGRSPSAIGALVGGDDVGDDAMPDDVRAGEVPAPQAVDSFEDPLEALQPGPSAGDAHLGGVTGDDDLRPEPDAGE